MSGESGVEEVNPDFEQEDGVEEATDKSSDKGTCSKSGSKCPFACIKMKNVCACFTLDKLVNIFCIGMICCPIGQMLKTFGCSFYLAFFTLWVAASIAYFVIAFQKLSSEGRAVLITGCDSGFGHALALRLHEMGFTVFAGCLLADRGGEGAEQLRAVASDTLHVLQMDVTNPQQLLKARKTLESLLPKGVSLWGLVNNAGLPSIGDIESVPLSVYRKTFDVNVFGVVSVTQAFLPLIRASKGRIVNMSSMYGCMPQLSTSAYVASTYAVEGLTDCLRLDTKRWGVDVITVEPGNFTTATKLITEEEVSKLCADMWAAMSKEVKEAYGEDGLKPVEEAMKAAFAESSSDPSPVLNALVDALVNKHPQARYRPMQLKYRLRLLIATHCPAWLFDAVCVGLPKGKKEIPAEEAHEESKKEE